MGGKIETNSEKIEKIKLEDLTFYDKNDLKNFLNNEKCKQCNSNDFLSRLIFRKSRPSPLFKHKLYIMGDIESSFEEQLECFYCRKCDYKF